MKFRATHKITFTPVSGDVQVFDVQLEADEAGDGPAYTQEEWDSSSKADWERVDGSWFFQGQTTPGGQPGYVRVAGPFG